MRDALASLAGIKPQVVPPVADPGTVIGAVSQAAAAETGLRAGTPIVAGGADHVLSAYAAGLASPGDWLVKLGGAGDILVVSGHPLVDERLYLDAHPVAGLWLLRPAAGRQLSGAAENQLTARADGGAAGASRDHDFNRLGRLPAGDCGRA